MRPKTLSKSASGQEVVDFLGAAYKDYIAARVLVLSDLLPQAAVLASTAIEKCMKAIIAFRGNESRGHLSQAQFNAVKNFDRALGERINPEFIDLLRKAYSLRYPDNLSNGFNLLIASREFLAELDWTAMMILESFNLSVDGRPWISPIKTAETGNDGRLIEDNFVLLRVPKQKFISAEVQTCFAIRKCSLRGVLEANFQITPRESDGKFMRPGMIPMDDVGRSYSLGFESLVPGGDRSDSPSESTASA